MTTILNAIIIIILAPIALLILFIAACILFAIVVTVWGVIYEFIKLLVSPLQKLVDKIRGRKNDGFKNRN